MTYDSANANRMKYFSHCIVAISTRLKQSKCSNWLLFLRVWKQRICTIICANQALVKGHLDIYV